MDIHFTDEHGNEFFIRIDEQVQVWKNKTQIEDVRFYPDEVESEGIDKILGLQKKQ